MNYLAFNRNSGGCYSYEVLCIDGVHVDHGDHYCHHNDDYGDYFGVLGACDGSCRKKYRPGRYDEDACPPKKVAVPDRVVAELVEPFLATGEKKQIAIPRPDHPLSAE